MLNPMEPIDELLLIFPGIMHHFHHLSSAVSRMYDLTVAQYRLMQVLSQRQQCTVNELAQELGIAQSSASEQATRMVKAGLLKRRPSQSDRRIIYVVLTNTSKVILRERADAMRNHLKKALDQLSRQQQLEFVAAFKKIDSLLNTTQNKTQEKQAL
ncbi:MAG: MarR family transcriptional regulator [Deferribacteres bacterium]|nr:MarR family transcriptional regulator [candidate division KSB1 bacterium]MCB9501100.1 MarR family transcriptional regulator [Deferribacteres bacterium]